MNKHIANYLEQLKSELRDSDKATIQDATADAHEHLSTALVIAREEDPTQTEEEAIQAIITAYGSPAEIAAAYQQAEIYMAPYTPSARKSSNKGLLARFFGIYGDPTAWGGLLYMILSLVTGIVYFTWAITGLSFSLVFSLFIFGIPFAVLFILSVHGLGLLEGRMVEGLLGVRMPRRPLYFPKDKKWFDRLKQYLADKQTWKVLLYLILQLVFGSIDIFIWVFFIALSLSFIAIPFIVSIFNLPVVTLSSAVYFLPDWTLPVIFIGGILLLTASMHIFKGVGKLHGKFARWALVAD